MAILPDDPFILDGDISIQDEPGLTWYIDKETKRIVGEVDGYAAVRQAVEIILRTDRYWWQIYSPSSGVYYKNLVGQDAGYVAMELQRRILEALLMDSRMTGLSNYAFTHTGDVLDISFVVNTVYGDVQQSMEVPIL